MKFEYRGYELDTEKHYLDRDGDVMVFTGVNYDGNLIGHECGSGVDIIFIGECELSPSEEYMSDLVEIEIKGRVKKDWKPEIGKIYLFCQRKDDYGCIGVFDGISHENHFMARNLFGGYRGSFHYCKPLPEGLEVGR